MGSYLVRTVSPLALAPSHVGGHMKKKATPKRYKVIVYKQKKYEFSV